MSATLALVFLAALEVESATLNSGGHPLQGTKLTSTNFRISLDAIGEVSGLPLTSASYRYEAGLVPRYVPPGEVTGLRFTNKIHLAWNGERSTGTYRVYRAVLTSLPGAFGGCLASGVASTAYDDVALPQPQTGLFYLVTAQNRLREEGTKGTSSNGITRINASTCP